MLHWTILVIKPEICLKHYYMLIVLSLTIRDVSVMILYICVWSSVNDLTNGTVRAILEAHFFNCILDHIVHLLLRHCGGEPQESRVGDRFSHCKCPEKHIFLCHVGLWMMKRGYNFCYFPIKLKGMNSNS